VASPTPENPWRLTTPWKPLPLGASSDPSRVFKGMRMAGRDGGARRTVQNLEIIKVLADQNLILVKGAVPGFNGSTVYIVK